MYIINKLKKYYLEIIIVALLITMYLSYSIKWVDLWIDVDSFYSYGLFMPLFMFFYFKQNSKRIAESPKKPEITGLVTIIIGVLFYILGERVEYSTFVNLSLPLILAGIILLLWGYKVFKISILPLIIITLCLPILPIYRVTTLMQLFFAESTTVFLTMLGVKTHNIGSLLYMNGYPVSIEPGCTGLKSLLNLTILSFMYSYFLNASIVKKTVFILASLPITFINNMLRVSLSGFYIIFNGNQGYDLFHSVLGLIFYAIGIAIILFISKLIEEPEYE